MFDLDSNGFGNQNSKSEMSTATTTTKMSKDSILALFNQPPAQQQQQQPMTGQHQNFMTVGQKNQFNSKIKISLTVRFMCSVTQVEGNLRVTRVNFMRKKFTVKTPPRGNLPNFVN